MADPTTDLELYAGHIAEVILEVRDEGLVLSSLDQHQIEQWWEAGYPLDVVLRAVDEGARKLKKRKRPPRGLPLKSLRRPVEKAGERARAASVGAPSAVASQPADTSVVGELVCALGDDEASQAAKEELQAIPTGVGPGTLRATLLGIGRRYYEARWQGLPSAERSRREQAVREQLGDALLSMDPLAAEETVVELARRALRTEDPVFDPDRYWYGVSP